MVSWWLGESQVMQALSAVVSGTVGFGLVDPQYVINILIEYKKY